MNLSFVKCLLEFLDLSIIGSDDFQLYCICFRFLGFAKYSSLEICMVLDGLLLVDSSGYLVGVSVFVTISL